ncbi:MAG: ribonuclease H-like domain-containing protein [Candidatus Edwardsbacteria bacterium]
MRELKVLILDLETLKNPDEVGGWGNCWKMGISVLGMKCLLVDANGIHQAERTYDIYTDPISVHRDTIINRRLDWANVIVSHNGLSFDYKVLVGALNLSWDWAKENLVPKTIDFCWQIKIRHDVRISLSNVATRTTGTKHIKALPGDRIVEYWRSGDPAKKQEVIQHCIDDVEWTSEIFVEMYKRTEWAKGVPTGRITFYNPYEAEKRKNGDESEEETKRRITGNCVISYPKKMQEFLIELKQIKKDPVLSMSGLGKEIWKDVDADDYVKGLREGW